MPDTIRHQDGRCKQDLTKDEVYELGFNAGFNAALQNTSSNSDYAKCKSIGCQFYDVKMDFNCCANENLCEKCMNSQHFA